MLSMFNRRTTGSVVCPSCGSLVGVRDDTCYSCGRANPGLWGFGPILRSLGTQFEFGPIVIGVCIALWGATLLISMAGGGIDTDGILSALSPSIDVMRAFGATSAYTVFVEGHWWTVLSAGWLHFGLLHIFMNMFWIRQMGSGISQLFGPARTVIIYTAGSVAGFALSVCVARFLPYLPMAPLGLTAGASAPVFGLIGALYHYGRSGSGIVKQMALSIMLQAALFGMIVPGINNYAHLGGFAGGYLASALLKPMTRERGDHMIIALACLVATVLSIIASIVTGLPLLRS